MTAAGEVEALDLVVDGIRVTVDVARWPAVAPDARRRFLLVHGNPSHIRHFRPLVPGLQRLGEVVALDLPGYGRRPSTCPPSLDWLADVVAALGRHLWPDGAWDLVGQSFGGGVVLTILVRHPALVRSAMVLSSVGTPAHASMRTGALMAKIRGAAWLAEVLARWLRGWFGRAAVGLFASPSFSPEPIPEGFATEEAALLSSRPWLLSTSLLMNLGDPSRQLAAQALRIQMPVLFVHGRDDQLVPISHARALYEIVAKSAPGSAFVVVEGGHMAHYTRPQVVLDAMTGWLARSEQ